MSLNRKRRDELRAKILRFCSGTMARTHREVAKKFGISGISAAAFLSGLVDRGKMTRIGGRRDSAIYYFARKRNACCNEPFRSQESRGRYGNFI
jgi:predicted HTH transcriptional regulator